MVRARLRGCGAGAVQAWERLRASRPNDYEANHRLATLYARQSDHVRSDQAIDRAFGNQTLTDGQRAELHALRGSNLKDRWMSGWRAAAATMQERQRRALRSPYLDAAMAAYGGGFDCDLDNYYAGLNTLALAQLQQHLAAAHPDTWRSNFDTNARPTSTCTCSTAAQHSSAWRSERALKAKTGRARSRDADPWLDVSLADHQFLSSDDRDRVVARYEPAAAALDQSQRQSVTRQLRLFAELGVRQELATHALAAVGAPAQAVRSPVVEALVFGGHMLDRDDESERFPARLEPAAATAIEARVRDILEHAQRARRKLLGLATASDGGDILFHEACARLAVSTEVYLPVPDELFRSTGRFSSGWLGRYFDVVTHRVVHTLNPSPTVPSWIDLRRETRVGHG